MPRACPSCATENADGAKFCNECGHRFGPLALTPPPARGAEYVTRRMTRDSHKRGERRVVTVLFADIKDYTRLSEQLDPEQIEDLVGGLFREFSEVITQQGGYVDKFMGDAILALFGAPRSLGDDAERAVGCALEMQRRAKQANLGRDVQLDVRIGLDTGEVVVGNLGQRGEYTAIGDPVNTANRVQNAAEIGAVFVSESTAQQVKARYRLAELEPRVLKGKAEPVALFRVEGAQKQTEHYGGPLVGRRRELDLLLASFEACVRENTARFVLVRADAGMGKNRLFYEFRRRLRANKHAPLRLTAAFAPVGMEPMQGLRQITRALLKLERSATPAELDAAVDRVVAESGAPPALADHLRFVLGRSAQTLAASGLETKQRREGAALALKHLLEHQAATGPLLLVLEDLHWADPDSVEFLRRFARTPFRGPVLVLALGRPEAIELVRDLLADPFENVELRPLEAAEIAALSTAILRDGQVDDALAAVVAERSGGNPFVAEELIKGLHEAGVLQRVQGRYRLMPGHSTAQIPVGVRSILAARIDALEPRDRTVLSALSILGREFRQGAAERLCGDEAEPAIQNLLGRGMLVDLGQDRGLRRFMFCHALLQEVAYSGLLKRDKTQLHRVAAAYYRDQMAADGTRDARRLSRLAWHLANAGDDREAASLHFEAGQTAARQWTGAFAAEQFSQALAALDRDAGAGLDGVVGPAARLRVVSELVEALKETGSLARAIAVAEQAATTQNAPPAALAQVLERAANAAWRKSELEKCLSFAASARGLYQQAGDEPGAARCALQEVVALTGHGRLAEATALFDTLAPAQDASWLMEYLRTAAVLCLEKGQTAQALEHERKRADLARQAGNRRMLASALGNVAMYASDLGHYGQAGSLFEEALGEYRRAGDLFNVSVVLTNLGNFRRRTGDVAGALAAQQEARTLAAELGDDYGVLVGDLNVATCQMSLGRFTQALRSFEHAEPALRRFKAPQLESQALTNRAGCAARTGDFRLARASLERARALNTERRNLRGLMQVDLQLSEDLLRLGDFTRSREALHDVLARARETGFQRYAVNACDRLLEGALLQRDLAALEQAMQLARQQAADPGAEDERRSIDVHGAILALTKTPNAAALAALGKLLPEACVTASDAVTLASAAMGAVLVADKLDAQSLRIAHDWADSALRAMEEGGRADIRHVVTLATRSSLRTRLGQDGQGDRSRAQAAAARLEAAWVEAWLQVPPA